MADMEGFEVAPKTCILPVGMDGSGQLLDFVNGQQEFGVYMDSGGQQQVVFHGADGQAWIYHVPVVPVMEVDNSGFQGLPKMGIPNPSGLAGDPEVFVNARQYYRILKRREARKKLVDSGKVPLFRKAYLHESRHNHAMKRKRTGNGRFGAAEKKVKVEGS